MSVAVMRFSRRFACAVAGARRFVYAPVCLRVLLPTWMGAVADPRRRAAASLRPGPARPGPVVFTLRRRVRLKVGQRSDAPA